MPITTNRSGQKILNKTLSESLREERHKSFQYFAKASQNNSIPAKEICEGWSAVADNLLIQAFSNCFQNTSAALFALGKLGSKELNLSSDVDLLIVSSEEKAESMSALRKFQKMLTESTALGFVFRVDFDLRPGGRHGPLIPTVDQFKDYYGSYGETWERLALLRMRPLCGDPNVIDDVMDFAKKFSFRRHLDFTLFDDLKNLRGKIQSQQLEKPTPGSLHLKLALGGIRDVELFTHALQVVHGGKDPELQILSTTDALNLLGQKKLLPVDEAKFLRDHYWNLRGLENYVQSEDQQTHLLNFNSPHPDWVLGKIPLLADQFKHCEEIVRGLLGDAPADISIAESLSEIGISDSEIQQYWDEILDTEVLSQNKGRDEAARKAFLKEFIYALNEQGGDLKRGLLLLKDFIRNTRAKATFFSLLIREKPLLKKLSWLFGHSPYLAGILCSRPELLDSFVYQSQGGKTSDLGQLLEDLTEKKLLSEILNGSQYLEKKDLPQLLAQLSSTTDSICSDLLAALKIDYPSKMEFLALGKWGGEELGFRSDLDFLLVIPDEATDGDHKLARRLISRLTESHRGGNIYAIDMRLRPSGKAGPLVISQSHLQEYLANEASAWERQAYLKSRWLGRQDLSLQKLCLSRKIETHELQELERIRQELHKNKSPLDLKYAEGGLIDVEFAAQVYLLHHQLLPKGPSTFDFLSAIGTKAVELTKNYARLRQLEQMLQLVASEALTNLAPNHESFQFLAKALQMDPEMLIAEAQSLLQLNTEILKELDPRPRPH
jgi:glutamate-ammonia-ligase adenylyltransferase